MISIIVIFLIIQNIENKDIEFKSFSDLQDKIDNLIGSELDLDSDYTFDSTKDKTNGIIIDKPLTINGNGYKINGANKARLFEIYNHEVHIKGVFFVNGFSEESGGAISLINSPLLELAQCEFSFNNANKKGGAINLKNSYLEIYYCTFKFNTGKSQYSSGGGIYSENSKVKVNITKFFVNSADEGGAISSINSTLEIYNSILYSNNANWYGGAILSDSEITIHRSRLYSNIAGYKGGAIHTTKSYLTNNCFLNINYSYIYYNFAEYGAAISTSNRQHVHIFKSELYFNHATFGAVISRMSVNDILISNSSCHDNSATYGSILYSPARGNNTFFNCNFRDNKADIGGLIYTISGRDLNKVTYYFSNFSLCNLEDNYGQKGLIYTFFDELIITNSSITYLNKSYKVPIIYKVNGGEVTLKNNWWGEKNPNLNKFIIYENYNITNSNKNIYEKNLRSEGCSSTVIQIGEYDCAFTFRRDSTQLNYVIIDYQKDGILQYKTGDSFFWHTIINIDGWVVGNGGTDSPHSCEKLEAYSKIMVKQNLIVDELIENAFEIKSTGTPGHFFIKSPNGTYVLFSNLISSKNNGVIEKGKLKSGEYIICPNDYNFYQKGNILDLKIKGNYTYISRYLAAIDQYSSFRTNEFTYNYGVKNNLKYIDVFISNDDGSLSNNTNTSNYFNDIFINDKYIFGERVPVIMDGMYLGRYTVSNKNLKMNIKLLLLFICLLF